MTTQGRGVSGGSMGSEDNSATGSVGMESVGGGASGGIGPGGSTGGSGSGGGLGGGG